MQVVVSGLAGWSLKVSDLRLSREEECGSIYSYSVCSAWEFSQSRLCRNDGGDLVKCGHPIICYANKFICTAKVR